jgi:hypothetical protein
VWASFALCLVLLAAAAPVAGQEPAGPAPQDATSAGDNPLVALNDELAGALASASVPFSQEQVRAIAMMMEDRRRASEELFGGLMDFRRGPTEGEQEDRLRSAIEWMRGEFIRSVTGYLTSEQAVVWERFQAERLAEATGEAASQDQTQYVRINNNAFTAEDDNFSAGGGNTEVIPRGGAGAWHGNAQFLLKDDALNARNPFAGNEPPYQERRLTVDVSGPAIPGRLTSSVGVSSTESKNVSTVLATRPDGVFALGITRPTTYRQVSSRSTLQLANSHSLGVQAAYGAQSSSDQGVGGFTLPERASDEEARGWSVDIRQFSAFTSGLFESRVDVEGRSSETTPLTDGVRINVLDAFNGGGAQNRSEQSARTYDVSTLYTRVGSVVTLKIGAEGRHEGRETVSTSNFGGTFTFSSLEDYVAGLPNNYRVTRGDPRLRTNQLGGAAFVQADAGLTSNFTLMLGARYQAQSNLDDFNNVSPRVSFGYSPGPATVIRGGAGIFYDALDIGMVENVRRFDGTRQFEIVVDDPSYPDPFGAGTVRQTFPSVRLMDPGLRASYWSISMASIERTFLDTLLVTATYDRHREFGRLRMRNLNAPFDATSPVPRACQIDQPADTCVRPDPSRGHVLGLEATGRESRHNVRLSARQRFSILNVSAAYQWQRVYGDVQGSPGSLASDSYDPGADWGRAPMPAHEVQATVNARLPFGVFLTGRMDANSGRHYTVTTGRDDNRDGSFTDRPPGVPPNSRRGPGFLDVAFNISKAVFFRRSGTGPNVNVFVNATNAFNHVHYGTPSGVLTSPSFGRSTSASNPREIEVGLRFQF